MTCESCQSAERDPLTNERSAGCLSCSARMFVRVGLNGLPPGQAHQAQRKQFGGQIEEGEALVEKWARRIRQARAVEVAK